MPAPKLKAYSRMLHQLQAQESLRLMNDLAMASGNLPKEAVSEQVNVLRALAAGVAPEQVDEQRAYRPRSPEELAALSGGTTRVIVQGASVTSTA